MKQARLKRIRRLGTPLPGLTRKAPRQQTRRAGGAGGGRPRKMSDFRVRLEEKQKVRWHYGISERQLRSAFQRASRAGGATGETLLALLERRLDNVVFRLGFAPTIPAARQLVAHGHVRVNGERVDRAGYRVEIGEVVTLAPRARRMPDVMTSVERGAEVRVPGYVVLDPDDAYVGRVVGMPARSDVPFIVDATAIVEFYAR